MKKRENIEDPYEAAQKYLPSNSAINCPFSKLFMWINWVLTKNSYLNSAHTDFFRVLIEIHFYLFQNGKWRI
jgi:hypothetical protein